MGTRVIKDESTGQTFTEVEPGSADDPFAAGQSAASDVVVGASPAVQLAGGAVAASTVEVPFTAPTATPTPTPIPAPASPEAPVVPASAAVAPASAAPAAPEAPSADPATPVVELSPAEMALKEGKLDDHLAGLVKEATGAALKNQQSGYDKRIQSLTDDLKDVRETSLKAEREGKLEDLTSEEQDILKDKWSLEDLRTSLVEYEDKLDGYFHSLYVGALVQEFSPYGVTAEDLDNIEESEDMDAFVQEKQLDWFKAGKAVPDATVTAPTRTVESPVAPPVVIPAAAPAGAQAPTDVGGTAPSSPPPTPDTGLGLDAMARNLAQMPWESLPIPN